MCHAFDGRSFVYLTILVAEHVNPASQVSSVVICYKVDGEMDLTILYYFSDEFLCLFNDNDLLLLLSSVTNLCYVIMCYVR